MNAVSLAKKFGIENVSGDLIVGLPGQDETDVIKAVELFDKLGLTHVSAYALTVEEGTPLYRSGYKTDDDREADLYDAAVGNLRKYGYYRYEKDIMLVTVTILVIIVQIIQEIGMRLARKSDKRIR